MTVGLSTQKKGQIGINVVERIVIHDWKCRWQPLDSVNDDGVDGLIFIEKGGIPNGQIVHVQVKFRSEKLKNGYFKIPKASKALARNAIRWRRIVGAAILVFVNPEDFKAYWVDLKKEGTITKSQILVPIENNFDILAKSTISKLCGIIHGDLLYKEIKLDASDFEYLKYDNNIKSAARKKYIQIKAANIKFKDSLAEVRFTREGWHLINRRNREPLARVHSWELLGVIEKALSQSSENSVLTVRRPHNGQPELVAISVIAQFPYRQAGVVRILFRRRYNNENYNYSFHTIYEPRRKRNLVGL